MDIIQATDADEADVRALFWEYLQWANAMLRQTFDISFDISQMLDGDMAGIQKFYPPGGRLFLARNDTVVAGCACAQTLAPGIAELKRTFVRPALRGNGIGRELVQALIADLRSAGYTTLRLDSANFMREAHGLYRSLDFAERDPYPESEIPAAFHANWVFMERRLDA
jgi:GNAT superfamily N-acetyltransferase